MKPHYSPSLQAGDLIFISGQLPLINRESASMPESISDQTRLVLQQTENLLLEYGLNRRHIVKTTAYITDIDQWPLVNKIYAEFFGDHKPARSVVPVHSLHFGCSIEVESIASIHLA
jgi:2-iminobutanoate/2-iminopropanoate deaminase